MGCCLRGEHLEEGKSPMKIDLQLKERRPHTFDTNSIRPKCCLTELFMVLTIHLKLHCPSMAAYETMATLHLLSCPNRAVHIAQF